MEYSFDEIVIHARTGLNPRKNFILGKGNNRYITIKNIKDNSLVIDDNTDFIDDKAIDMIHKRSQIKKGDILFASIGRFGDTYIIEEEPTGWDINESVFAFTVDEKLIRQKYFHYLFKHKETIRQLTKNSSGSTFKSIKMNQLKKMRFDLPDLNSQDIIVSLLDCVTNIISIYEQELLLLDELVKARFVEMFGNPVSNSKDLPIQKMSNVAPICQYDGSFEERVWLLNLDMVESQTGRIINYNIVGKDEIGGSVCTFDENNILYSKLRPYLNKVVIPNDKGYATSELVPLRPDNKIINRIYLAYLLRSNEFVEMIKEKVAGAKMPRVSMSDFREFNVPIPPLELQNQFASFVQEIDKSRSHIQKSLEASQELFDSLMQEYFG